MKYTFKINDKDYSFSDWSLGTCQKVMNFSDKVTKLGDIDIIDYHITLGSFSLEYDYPEITVDFIKKYMKHEEFPVLVNLMNIQTEIMQKKTQIMMEQISQIRTSRLTGETSTQE